MVLRKNAICFYQDFAQIHIHKIHDIFYTKYVTQNMSILFLPIGHSCQVYCAFRREMPRVGL